MKRSNLFLIVISVLLVGCAEPVLKGVAYKDLYTEKPASILIMPPINKSTNVEAKESFYTTLYKPLSESGYYVISPFLALEIMRRESAYDAELFMDNDLSKFGEVFGADAALFTIIHKWNKSSIGMSVTVEVEYILRSCKTNKTIYTKRGTVRYDANSNSGNNALVNIAAALIKTAAVDYILIARKVNAYALSDLPQGKYSSFYLIDDKENAGKNGFNVTVR